MKTLDGLSYTFNGAGEFVLLQDIDRKFTTQVRLEQVVDENGMAICTMSVISLLLLFLFNCYHSRHLTSQGNWGFLNNEILKRKLFQCSVYEKEVNCR